MKNHVCVIELGSNDPDIKRILAARLKLEQIFPDIRFSRIFQTEPVDFPSLQPFHNQTAIFHTAMKQTEIVRQLKDLESASGRLPSDKSQGIVHLDLDLLSYSEQVLKPLDIQRDYVQKGMADLGLTSPYPGNAD